MTAPPILISTDRQALMARAAAYVADLAEAAIVARGRFTWALAGGSTPRALYALLATRYAARIDWACVHFFWGDERCVSKDHAESNYRMVRETLLDAVKPPSANVHRMRGEEPPARAAAEYERELHRFFGTPEGGPPPRLDLVLLGMGTNGHIASLFPGSPALTEKIRWVVPSYAADATVSWRLTFTPVLLDAAARVLLLVSGEEKAKPLKEVFEPGAEREPLPVTKILRTDGTLTWMVDAAAASELQVSP